MTEGDVLVFRRGSLIGAIELGALSAPPRPVEAVRVADRGKQVEAVGHEPWSGNDEMRFLLEMAGWRYAVLIGVVRPDGNGVLVAHAAADRDEFGDLVKTAAGGKALWVCEDAAAFVQKVTGFELEICKRWLDYDWPA